jgi:SAM-dependent methyltransferase
MRVTYRDLGVEEYWNYRWDNIPADQPMENSQIYPLKYAEQIIKDRQGKILEAGCGAGRILRYYHNQGLDIIGVDFIEVAIEKLKKVDSTLKVEVADITALRFESESFKYVLAFGLYHNLEYGLDQAIQDTYRILEKGGSLCASFRADNIQTKLTDWLAKLKENRSSSEQSRAFHKMNLTRSEFKQVFEKSGFSVDSIKPVENMPILYKFSFFRASNHIEFDENLARTEGYQLSWFGQKCQNFLMRFFPNQFCNIYVIIAHK